MVVTHEFTMTLDRRGVTPVVDAVQGDANTRAVKVTLTAGGVPFTPPAGAVASVAFRKPDGKKGWYDKLPDGSAACTTEGNTVTAILAPEVLTVAGQVEAVIILQDADLNQLATFEFTVNVAKNPAAGVTVSNDYYNYSTMAEVNAALDGFFVQADREYAPAIVCEKSGSVISANDASNRLLQGLTLYGKTTQDGTPTPENPVELVSAGSVGSIGVTITDEADQNAQTLTASTPNGLLGIGDVKDEIDFFRGVYMRRIGIAVYDGSDDEEWQVLTTRSGSKRFLIQIPTSKPVDSAKIANLLNSQFLSVSADSIYANDAVGCAINQNSSLIVHTPQIQTLDALKAHLENKPMTVAYELATPIETPLSAEELAQYSALHTNKPNISAYNDAGAGMKIAYVADTKLYIDKKFNELAAAIVNNA